MPSFLELTPEQQASHALNDRNELRDEYRPYRQRMQTLLDAAFPDKGSTMTSLPGSALWDSKGRPMTMQRSKVISEWVGTRADAMINRTTRARTNIVPDFPGADIEGDQRVERLIKAGIGLFRLMDRTYTSNWNGVSFDEAMKSQIAYLGKTIIRTHVTNQGGGLAGLNPSLIDPLNSYHDIGQRFYRRFITEFNVPSTEIELFAASVGGVLNSTIRDKMGKQEDLTVTEYWRSEEGLVFRGYFVEDEPIAFRQSKFKRIPIGIFYRARNPRTFINHEKHMNIVRHADPFYSRAVSFNKIIEGIASLGVDNLALSIGKIITERNPGNEARVDAADLFPFNKIFLDGETELDTLDLGATTAIDVNGVLDWVTQQLEGMFPSDLVSVTSNPGDTGILINSKLDQNNNFLVPWTRVAEAAKLWHLDEILQQLKETNLEFRLSGKSPLLEDYGQSFTIGLSGKDVPASYVLDIEEPPELPTDELRAMQIYREGIDSGAWDDINGRVRALRIGQPYRMREMVKNMQVAQHPFTTDIALFEQLEADLAKLELEEKEARKTGDEKKIASAAVKVIAAKRQLSQIRRNLLGQPQAPAQVQGVGNPPPEVQPPEARGFESPDIQAQVQGISTSTAGRPRPPGTP